MLARMLAARSLAAPCLVLILAVPACRSRPPERDAGPTPAPMIVEGPPPEILAVMSCNAGAPRLLRDGTLTRGLWETLIVRRDGDLTVHDFDVNGAVIAHRALPPARLSKLDAIVSARGWAGLPHLRGAPFPDGAVCEIQAAHRRVKRFDLPDDEPLAKDAWAELHALWREVDR